MSMGGKIYKTFIKGRYLLWSMVGIGMILPMLPHLIVPLVNPHTNMGMLRIMLEAPLAWAAVCLWTAVPFAVLAFSARAPYMGDTITLASSESFLHLIGISGAFLAGFATGFFCHAPRSSLVASGVNFGVILFPFYAIVVMPFGYGIGRVWGWFILRLKLNRGREL